jgi:hypothetical protein
LHQVHQVSSDVEVIAETPLPSSMIASIEVATNPHQHLHTQESVDTSQTSSVHQLAVQLDSESLPACVEENHGENYFDPPVLSSEAHNPSNTTSSWDVPASIPAVVRRMSNIWDYYNSSESTGTEQISTNQSTDHPSALILQQGQSDISKAPQIDPTNHPSFSSANHVSDETLAFNTSASDNTGNTSNCDAQNQSLRASSETISVSQNAASGSIGDSSSDGTMQTSEMSEQETEEMIARRTRERLMKSGVLRASVLLTATAASYTNKGGPIPSSSSSPSTLALALKQSRLKLKRGNDDNADERQE